MQPGQVGRQSGRNGSLFLFTLLIAAFCAGTAFSDTVFNPATNQNEEIDVQIKRNDTGAVIGVATRNNYRILTDLPGVGSEFLGGNTPEEDTDDTTQKWKVKSQEIVNDRVVSYTAVKLDADGNEIDNSAVVIPVARPLTADEQAALRAGAGGPGSENPPATPAVGASDVNVVTAHRIGSNGANGSNGYGVSFKVFGYRITIGRLGTAGSPGRDSAAINLTVTPSTAGDATVGSPTIPNPSPDGSISIATARAGILAVSQGGSGGKGGDTYGALPGLQGGAAGRAGNVSVTNSTNISGNGIGILASSQAGKGGDGGEGVIFSSGGNPGAPAQSGTTTVVNSGTINTIGNEHHGIIAQSLGGKGGNGGSTSGVVGDAASGSPGGNGNAVTVTNSGTISTNGRDSHAILAQSIGGAGGTGGSESGLVSLGAGAGGGGGRSGTVTVNLLAGSALFTQGANSFGVLAQSVGGGGGNGGSSSGFVSIGGAGGEGNVGGTVQVTTAAGASVRTAGAASFGVLAQSVGGGGGNGGSADGISSIGGAGGSGGDGGSAAVSNAADIDTSGADARGLVVQSIGGGGGNGGSASSASPFAGVAIGGNGGGGGNGGNASLALGQGPNGALANITTRGDRATGILAQSIGGGGGNGGRAVAGSIGFALSGSVSIGGSGGGGGNGGAVSVSGAADILTFGQGAQGMLAQSVGGGGGNGGLSVSATASGGPVAGAVALSIGGSGGDGGTGGTVIVGERQADGTIRPAGGSIITRGDFSQGLIAQSLGGGGGNGGFAVAGAAAVSASAGGAASIGIGGTGGRGGAGGSVTAHFDGAITTSGMAATGLLVQSAGGGGGSGGFAIAGSLSASGAGNGAVSVGIGGSGGNGGAGGTVTATVGGQITTRGTMAGGIVVQSIGGGGGAGGMSIAGALSASGGTSAAVSVGIGGSGGGGGAGGTVSATTTADVTTEGDKSNGIVVQSIGGGGGAGGMAIAGALSLSGGNSLGVSVGLGGSGGSGNRGGQVTANLAGTITTKGADSSGIIVQSVGGGGGAGGMSIAGALSASGGASGAVSVGLGGSGGAGGTGGTVSATVRSDVTTDGDRSTGIIVQSVGGGGGAGGLTVAGALGLSGGNTLAASVGLGGNGGSGNRGGQVTADISGTVLTRGDDAGGIVVQSIGGSGGTGGMNISGGLSAAMGSGGSLTFGMGGSGGSGGTGGPVALTFAGSVRTEGLRSDAITVQSVGGGGGNGGMNISGSLSASGSSSATASVGLGGTGGSGGAGGTVTATLRGGTDGEIFGGRDGTKGSNGIVVQSVGGGGGNGGMTIAGQLSLGRPSGSGFGATVGLGGRGGDGGAGGAVTASADFALIDVQGEGVTGFLAQSVGGGGGNGGISISGGAGLGSGATFGLGGTGGTGGTGGAVTASQTGNITAQGEGSRGFVAQSIGGGGGNGGISIAGRVAYSSTSSNQLVLGIGGAGGSGNAAGNVTATQVGNVAVTGGGSVAILAQSVGGGGGAGGVAISGTISRTGAQNGGVMATLGVGGRGGTGGHAGNVELTSNGNASAAGDRAIGIVAQSVGGGGGTGGFSVAGFASNTSDSVAVSVGGAGGAAGNGGTVTVNRGSNTPTGTLTTDGNEGIGLLAQSVGGGGGLAGMAMIIGRTGSDADGAKEPKSVTAVIGGDGGAAGSGGAVTVNHRGTILTTGNKADGLVAQSLGGGGGMANLTVSQTTAKGGNSFSLALGGRPGDGSNGGTVTVDHSGDIGTEGDDSSAIFAQSVGGGGGDSAMNHSSTNDAAMDLRLSLGQTGGTGGAASDVAVTADGRLVTTGDRSTALLAQSVGGGGGRSGTTSIALARTDGEGDAERTSSAAMQLGLNGAMGGAAGNVTVTTSGRIATAGTDSFGIHAQSIGGGGGVGGSTATGIENEAASFRVGLGGTGGSGATGGNATVTNSAVITTDGLRAIGLLAQSVGGGGGVGGQSITLTQQENEGGASSYSVTATLGGTGGAGAAAGRVSVNSSGQISTLGDAAHGLLAQSVGGGGGIGGVSQSSAETAGAGQRSASLQLGGRGGTGGTGGAVDVENSGSVVTEGRSAIGIAAQSIGGGGGMGGLATSLRVSEERRTEDRLSLTLGGSGGSGGLGGAVSVTNTVTGDIATSGDDSHGIAAQSIGGGGGAGGAVSTLAGAPAGASTGGDSRTYGLAVGGGGGDGNAGGSVTVLNAGRIETAGDRAYGIVAQSIGGGGGNGGMVVDLPESGEIRSEGRLLSLGGGGGDGNDGGAVSVTNSGTIVTEGRDAHGIVAQSVGGGGGNAQLTLGAGGGEARAVFRSGVSVLLGAVGLGGGTGGVGGTVMVENSGTIQTSGEGARGIVAESINGGGGSLVVELDRLTLGTPANLTGQTISLIQGADGGDGMTAGRVEVRNTGTILALGDNGAGGSVQAIGGGGGTTRARLSFLGEGDAAGNNLLTGRLGGSDGTNNTGGAVDTEQTGDTASEGVNAPVLLLQSIGGGGGRLALVFEDAQGQIDRADYTLGALRGSANRGGSILHNQSGRIDALGQLSFGMIAQSIGGGGGMSSWILPGQTARLAMPRTAGRSAAPMAAFAAAPAAVPTFTLGADAAVGADGANVAITRNGASRSSGDLTSTLIFQSIGGGGGVQVVSGAPDIAVALGGRNGTTGSGGEVRLVNDGAVVAEGASSSAIFLQSIGGGGGTVLSDASNVALSFSTANSGNGGVIVLDQKGDVLASGDGAFGVFAQSVGGGGGFVTGVTGGAPGFARFAGTAGGTGTGGAITLSFDGSVRATGAGSVGIFAQSTGQSGGPISLTLASTSGVVLGGAGGIGVQFDGGAANTLTSRGTIATRDGAAGLAILASGGDDRVESFGAILGSVDLGAGANGVTIRSTAILASGARVVVGDGNLVLVEGQMRPGDFNLVQTTALTGNYRQTASATLHTDLDFGTMTADLITVTGSADLSGVLAVNIFDPLTQVAKARPGTNDTLVVTAGGPLTFANLSLAAPDTAVARYALRQVAPGSLALRSVVNYAPDALGSRNTLALGAAINDIQSRQTSPRFAPVATQLFLLPQVADLRSAYELLGGSGVVSAQQVGFGVQARFGDVLSRRDGVEGTQGWATLSRGWGSLPGNDGIGSFGTKSAGTLFAAGMDFAADTDLTFGFGIGSGVTSYAVQDVATIGTVNSDHVGIYGTYRDGNWRLSGSLSAARLVHEYARQATIPGVTFVQPGGTTVLPPLSERLAGRQTGSIATVSLELGYAFDLGATEVTPFIGVANSRMRLHAFNEYRPDGAPSVLALGFESQTLTSTPLTLGVEIRHEGQTRAGNKVSGWMRALWEHDLSNDRGLTAGFLSASGGSFGINGTAPERNAFKVSAGLEMELDTNVTAHIALNGRFSGNERDYGAEIGINFKW
ncbi:MAG: hypothetical protein RL216_292 [Pseudomonadota bacterium]